MMEKKMEFRTAKKEDLARMKAMYRRLYEYMEENGIHIWDDYYPCELLEDDIEKEQLYGLFLEEQPIAGFALCTANNGENHVQWEDPKGTALYMERLGVAVEHLRRGYASEMLQKAVEVAGAQGVEYLRLFAAASNPVSLALYRKNGFQQAEGVFLEQIDENWILLEYGFEIQTKP